MIIHSRTSFHRLVSQYIQRRLLLTHSVVSGPTDTPLVTASLPQYFANQVLAKYAARPALICRSEPAGCHSGPSMRNLSVSTHLAWDYEEFNRHIWAAARGLIALGVHKGDRVGVIMGNNSAYATLQLACASIGAILVTINPAYRLNELVSTLNLVGVKHLFLVPRIRSSGYISMLSKAYPDLVNSQPGDIQDPNFPHLRNLVLASNLSKRNESPIREDEKAMDGFKSIIDWREILLWQESARENEIVKKLSESLEKDDVINLQFTSGTTGLPKAVSLTHSNLLNNAISIARCMRLTPEDIVCNPPPLFHCFDKYLSSPAPVSRIYLSSLSTRLVLGNLAAWSTAACIVYPSPSYDPKSIVDAVTQEKCTALHGVPTHFYGVLEEVEKRRADGENIDTRALRTGIAAGSPIPIGLMRQLIDKMGLTELTNAYGMTETSPVSFQTAYNDPLLMRVETVGKVQPHVRAKIIDHDDNIVPVNTPGEVVVAGYLLQKEYWGDQEQTDKVMRRDQDGTLWMYTGDEGIMDEQGYLKIVGRIKASISSTDIIIRGGENLFPVQIENVLSARSGIEESAIVAVPDSKYGEVVGAWVVRHQSPAGKALTAEDVRNTVIQGMNPQNAPAYVWFMGESEAPEQLPRTASGKVQKHILRNWSKEMKEKGIGKLR